MTLNQFAVDTTNQSPTTVQLEETLDFMINRFSFDSSEWLASAIVSHLEELTSRPDTKIRHGSNKLLSYWRQIHRHMGATETPNHEWQLSIPTIQRRIRMHNSAIHKA